MKLKEESAISANFVEDVAVVKEKERERENVKINYILNVKLKINMCVCVITVFILCPRDLLRSDDCISQWFNLERLCLSFRRIKHNDRWDKLKS